MIDNFRTDLICAAILFAAAMVSLGFVSSARGWLSFGALGLGALAFLASAVINARMAESAAVPAWLYAVMLALVGAALGSVIGAIGMKVLEA